VPQLLIPPARHDRDRAAGSQHRGSTDERLRLLTEVASHVQTVTKGAFEVYGSAWAEKV
jgi:hypothetical protein